MNRVCRGLLSTQLITNQKSVCGRVRAKVHSRPTDPVQKVVGKPKSGVLSRLTVGSQSRQAVLLDASQQMCRSRGREAGPVSSIEPPQIRGSAASGLGQIEQTQATKKPHKTQGVAGFLGVGGREFESPTSTMSTWRSNQLS